MKPQLARTYGPKYDQFPCYLQPKLNGIRALYQSGTFQSRDEKLWSPNVLAHLLEPLQTTFKSLGPLILDGELYMHGWRLQRINSAIAVNRKEPTADTPFVQFHVFDVVDPTRKFSDRWFDVYSPLQLADHPLIRAVSTAHIWLREELEVHFQHHVSQGYEGVMLRPDGLYEFGEHIGRGGTPTSNRSKHLWKYKSWEDDEFVCVGVTQGEGKADIGIGALVLAAKPEELTGLQIKDLGKFITFNCGTGIDDPERIFFMQNPPIGKLVRVRFPYRSENGVPQCPSFLAVL